MDRDQGNSQSDSAVTSSSRLLSALLSTAASEVSDYISQETKLDNWNRPNKVQTDDYTEAFTLTNTPLTVQRNGLVTVSREEWEKNHQNFFYSLGSSHTSELAWVIPMAIGAIFVFIVLALLFFYGVRTLELKIGKWCYRHCGCCAPGETKQLGEELQYLTASRQN